MSSESRSRIMARVRGASLGQGAAAIAAELAGLGIAPAAPLPEELLQLVDIATPNETELSLLTGMPTATSNEVVAAAERLIELGVGDNQRNIGGRFLQLVGHHCGNLGVFRIGWIRRRWRVAGKKTVRPSRMLVAIVMQAADDGEFVRHLRQIRE